MKSTPRLQRTINTDWKFHRGDCPAAFAKGFDDTAWKQVTLPHDWSVGEPFSHQHSSGGGYLAGGVGWYRTRLQLPAEAAGKRVSLVFDGVYNNSQVWVNSYYLGRRPYGYSTFSHDISHAAGFGPETTEIAVRVDHKQTADSRWFTGSGITRKVSLIVQEPVCIAHQGVFFRTTRSGSTQATIAVGTTIANHTAKSVQAKIRNSLITKAGQTVAKLETACLLPAGEELTLEQTGLVDRPQLWSPEHPHLYTLKTELVADEAPMDQETTQVGIRSCRFDANQGFFLNDANLKLKGVCLHHDAGCLGAAVVKKVWQRRLTKLKEMGCNAIRMSHYPHMPELYDLCDEMGFLAIDEAFDEWEGPKNKWWQGHNVYPPQLFGYWEDFPEWHEQDLAAMVRRDRNHPCVILWSIGNEIDYPNDPYCHPHFRDMTGNNDANKPAAEREYNPNRPNAERLVTLARQLSAVVKKWDTTRPVTAAVAFPELSNITGYCDTLEVCGYNYKEQWYESDHAAWPGRILLGSENSHSFAAWKSVLDHDYISGQFLWTGIDYLGEAHGWPIHGSAAGLLDLAGFPKPRYHFRHSLWSSRPTIQLASRLPGGADNLGWNYPEGETVEVICFTNCPRVSFSLNGQEIATHQLADFADQGFIHFTTIHRPGCLEATATLDGQTVQSRLLTTGTPAALVAQTDYPELRADGEDIVHLELRVVDNQGNWVPQAEVMVWVQVEGAATLLGIENGNLADCSDYAAPIRRTYNGRLLVYLRATRQAGPVKITCRSDGPLLAAVMDLQAVLP